MVVWQLMLLGLSLKECYLFRQRPVFLVPLKNIINQAKCYVIRTALQLICHPARFNYDSIALLEKLLRINR